MNNLEPKKLILIGASTGGPGHIQKILMSLDFDFEATIVVALHMQRSYIPSFVTQLDKDCNLQVHQSDNAQYLQKGDIYLLSQSAELHKTSFGITINHKDIHTTYSPSVDMLFHSAVHLCKELPILSIVLTGIGDDGASGSQHLSQYGAKCINESEESAIVYGMPKRAFELNPNSKLLKLDDIIEAIKRF